MGRLAMKPPALMLLLLFSAAAASAKRHYIFTAPKEMVAGERERVCLTLFNTPETGELTLELGGTHHRRTVSGVAGGSKQNCFEVDVPGATHTTDLVLSVTFSSVPEFKIKNSHAIKIRSQKQQPLNVFIQTDKAVYKPGQLVQLRVLILDEKLRPILDKVPLVYIESPAGSRLAQWNDVTGPGGLVQLELQLSDEPSLGQWKIFVQRAGSTEKHKKTFKVEEYVLPKFSVNIKGPPAILLNDEEVTWSVCAKYTYGKPVRGSVKLNVKKKYYRDSEQHWTEHTDDADCAVFRKPVPASKSRGDLLVHAEFTEDGTDVVINATQTFKVHQQSLKLSTDDTNKKYFKPGLPFHDKIHVSQPDGSPAAGEAVKLCYTVFYNGSGINNLVRHGYRPGPPAPPPDRDRCLNVVSDSAGNVPFTVPIRDDEIEQIEIKATAPAESRSHTSQLRSATLTLTLQGWHSDSGSYLQLGNTERTFSCGDTASLPLYFTTRLGTTLEMFYQVMSRGNILLSESTRVTFDTTDELPPELTGGTVIGASAGTPDQHRPLGITTLQIPVTPDMSSDFKVVVWTVVDDEVVADSRLFAASPCLENTAGVAWSPSRVGPGESVRLTVSAAAGSVCGIDVVDKSVNLLSSDNRISLSDFYKRLERLNLGSNAGHTQLDDDQYCRKKYGSPYPRRLPPPFDDEPSHSEIPEDFVFHHPRFPPRRHRYYEYEYSWKTTYADSLTAFDSWATAVLSDFATEGRSCHVSARRRRFDCRECRRQRTRRPGGPARRKLFRARPSLARPRAPHRGSVLGIIPATVVPLSEYNDVLATFGNPTPSVVPETVRTYFPETWLFELHTVSDDGTVTLTREAPDTITEWVAGAVCTSSHAGLGLAPPAPLTTFQPFFISFTLPYSVKRGEELELKVSVLNYNSDALPVKLTLVASEEFDTLSPAVLTACVSADVATVLPFLLRPSQLDDVNVTVVAEVYPELPQHCGSDTAVYFNDAVTRPILVEPEGYEREVTKSTFMCDTPDQAGLSSSVDDLDVTWPLTLPADLVPGSQRAKVTVVGDLLGPSIDNLDSLVRQPTGCGEQNMILFSPNIHVMNYLTAVGELTETLKQKLVKHMKTGYQRELTYRHNDKSFSAFGNSDSSGSMWLTAFVVRSFGDARRYIFIDDADLSESVRWIERHQESDGCFPTVGRVLHKDMKGGVAGGGQQALTAFVTVALLKSEVTLQENTLRDAFRCLDQETAPDLYTLSLRTYARAVAGHIDQARAGLTELRSRANRDRLVHWSGVGKNRALAVEMTAYNVLTLTTLAASGVPDTLVDALSAVRWITEQRNSRGGFVSTQDTVLALEALAAYARGLPRSSSYDMRLTASADGRQLGDVMSVTSVNRLVTQTREIDAEQLPADVRLKAEGTGCALVQAMLRYNVKEADPSEAFTISVRPKPKTDQKECIKHSLEICVSYVLGDGESNMAVIELDMVSGFIPSKSSLEELKKDTSLGLKRWEVNNNRVVMYFDELTARQICLPLVVQREHRVDKLLPATAKVYDYYHEELSISTSYKLDANCETVPIRHPEPL